MEENSIRNLKALVYSILIYFIVIFLVFFKLIEYKPKAIEFTDDPNSFVNIELGDSVNTNQVSITQEVQKENLQSLFEENLLQKYTTNKNVNTQDIDQKASVFNDLFGKIEDYQEEKTTKVQSSMPSKKPIFTQREKINDFSQQLNENLQLNQELGQSLMEQKIGAYDQFLGAVRKYLEDRWRIYNPSGNLSIEVEFVIDNHGQFYLLSSTSAYSDNFDKKAKEFLQNLEGKYITLPPNGKIRKIKMQLSDVIEFKTEK
ncbi:Tol-Pal system subunit TolA [Campylobacter subantarcticus LMG 24377]|uniref:Tol-Pal system subunit TolA n=1 Tax=Campylobacter subantarcticus TaxID=497724 RepID=A0ABW9N7H3_9BACT|nr:MULTISPECIES: Tol-Pal system subunit TolA [Campylobacter]AJC91770.1 Tol-Pal system subunit TolA [Campylobacter subantarcticus LMG 24377]EAL3939218.1 Tol-Pal system subunit TolA [Campylobacter lari]MPC00099.1 Tol-Pal system subunit TolA [Campylobacter subantarcticus]QOR01377.1 Tol-Pal system subunit TolA [Campylobacter sp. 2014D-0216]